MAFVVIYDTCVLYPAPIRDLLMRIAITGVVRARWSDESSTSSLKKHPDDFVLESLDLAPARILQCVKDQAAALKKPPMTETELLDGLRRVGLVQSVARMRDLLGSTPAG